MKIKWYIKQQRDKSEHNDSIQSWTITTNPEYCGWITDSGCDEYGLPKELAQWICDKLNAQDEKPPFIMNPSRTWKKS